MTKLADRWAPWLLAACGLFLSFHPMLLSGLERIQGDTGDTRLLNYILEHEYRAVVRWEPGRALWDPPFFHPVRNLLAHSDTLLTTLPVYAVPRLAGLPPDTAFQWWWMAMSALNYAGALLLLRRALNCSGFAAAAGAFLFAFGAPRIAQTGHQQLFAHFYTMGCLYALARLLKNPGRAPRWWIAVFAVCYAAQFYASFYLWFFLTLALAVAGGLALMHSAARERILAVVRSAPMSTAMAAIAVALVLAPGAMHYAEARNTIGPRATDEMMGMLPRSYSWIYMGPHNWLYRWQSRVEPFRSLYMEQEHRLGIGLLTTIMALWGLYVARRRESVRLIAGVSAILMAAVTVWAPGIMLWPHLAPLLPSGDAVRATGRVALLALLAASLGLAFALEALRKRSMVLTSAALAVCICEQVSSTPSFDKIAVRQHVAKLASEVGRDCTAFLYTPARRVPLPPEKLLGRTIKNQIDAMWAQFDAAIPAVNGYSGYPPSDWPFASIAIYTQADRARAEEHLAGWARARGLDVRAVCRVETRPDETWDPGNLADFLRRRGLFGLRY